VDATRAERAGLAYRPLTRTVAAIWQWMIAGGVAGDERWKENGIDPARERQCWIGREAGHFPPAQ
jgi:hypothetical protein